MPAFRFCTAFFLVAAATSLSTAQQVTLERVFRDGAKQTTVTETKMAQTLTISGREIATGNEQTITVVAESGKRAADGTIKLQRKIVGMTAKVSLPGLNVEFDSAKPDAAPANPQLAAAIDIFKAMNGARWSEVRGKDNRVISVEGSLNVLENLGPESQNALRDQLDPEYLKRSANREMDKLPSKPVTKGDKWDLEDTQNLGAGQKMTFKTTYQYEGQASLEGKSYDKISFSHTGVAYQSDPKGGLPWNVKKSDLKVASSKGEMFFDRRQGAVIRTTEKVHIQGELVFAAGGQELPGKLDLTIDNLAISK